MVSHKLLLSTCGESVGSYKYNPMRSTGATQTTPKNRSRTSIWPHPGPTSQGVTALTCTATGSCSSPGLQADSSAASTTTRVGPEAQDQQEVVADFRPRHAVFRVNNFLLILLSLR